MTQSGQGDEQQLPAVRPAHEGVVLPAGGGEPWAPGGAADGAAPAGGQPWGQPWGPQTPPQHGPAQGAPQGAYGQQQPPQYGQQPPPAPYGQQPPQHGTYGQGQPSPYGQTPPAPQQPQQPQPYAQPLPPEAGPGGDADADATQYIAPIPAGPGPGGLPPESPAESTTMLGRVTPRNPRQPAAHQAPPGGQDADATQYIPPVPGGAPYGIRPGEPGDRQPPAEFDNLFRDDEPAGATQQIPRFDPAQQPYHGGPPQQGYHQDPPYSGPEHGLSRDDMDDAPRKRPAHVPLIAAVVVGCAVIGLGAGALMSGGGDDKDKDAKQPVAAASSPAAKASSEPAADPAKPQAEALDKLLADSNNSRAAVIGAVEKTKNCTDLDKAVADLKGAAQQRRDLVTRLQALTVDKLPNHDRLTAALTKAWQASASADDHYAGWATQAKSKKVCKNGKARPTSHYRQANAQSGEATRAKQQAAALWNAIATKYGLTKRAATAL
ncbi:hypothetical protein [Streptomyces sp. NPDC059783]|uniref:hypothetical protein n=1 Tax=Streptomyces sp. NPDC059783 TaxID=3346944 RepID=UPI003654907D